MEMEFPAPISLLKEYSFHALILDLCSVSIDGAWRCGHREFTELEDWAELTTTQKLCNFARKHTFLACNAVLYGVIIWMRFISLSFFLGVCKFSQLYYNYSCIITVKMLEPFAVCSSFASLREHCLLLLIQLYFLTWALCTYFDTQAVKFYCNLIIQCFNPGKR